LRKASASFGTGAGTESDTMKVATVACATGGAGSLEVAAGSDGEVFGLPSAGHFSVTGGALLRYYT
jgi:hypothetical protein